MDTQAHEYRDINNSSGSNDHHSSNGHTKTQSSVSRIERMELNLSSLQSVVSLVNALKNRNLKIDILINNAAAMVEPAVTEDQIDMQFQSNYLSHALLALLLLHYNLMNAYGRIIHVTSLMHYVGMWPIASSVIERHGSQYNRFQMYNNTKLYLIMFTNELHRILKGYVKYQSHSADGTGHDSTPYHTINTYAVHPGACDTEFIDHFIPSWFHKAVTFILHTLVTRTPQEGTERVSYGLPYHHCYSP
jgi:NAD(P)-dependent dehydrogenase (short-subunit alcohol dehydrogenase family)